MGGKGSGHKSARATQARRENIQKARAARRRAPLPWRSGLESRIIEQLVWQWWMDKNSGKWLVASGEGKQQQIPRRYAPRNDSVLGQTGGQRSRRASTGEILCYKDNRPAFAEATARQASGAPTKDKARRLKPAPHGSKPWTKYRVARLLGVSHTWVNKLVRRFEADPDRMRRKMAAFAPASFEKLEQAREETRRQRERGWLRGPIRWRRVSVTIEGRKRKVAAPTRSEGWRRELLRESSFELQRDSASRPPRRAGAGRPAKADNEKNKQQIPHPARARQVRNDNVFVAYRELPTWARGLLLPGDPRSVTLGSGTQTPSGRMPATRHGEQAAGRPRAVPFAFRRRR